MVGPTVVAGSMLLMLANLEGIEQSPAGGIRKHLTHRLPRQVADDVPLLEITAADDNGTVRVDQQMRHHVLAAGHGDGPERKFREPELLAAAIQERLRDHASRSAGQPEVPEGGALAHVAAADRAGNADRLRARPDESFDPREDPLHLHR